MNPTRPPQVLIAGAGPTGLVLALCLTRHGVPVRIIDNDSGPGFASRAIALHARTLEFYAQLGIADEVVARGLKMDRIHLRRSGKSFAEISLKDMGHSLSSYPFMLDFPQDDHEQFLVETLKKAGVEVDWNVTFKTLTQRDTAVRAVLDKAGTEEICDFDYLCGCDGARSQVRKVLNINFPGGTYEQLFYVADVRTNTVHVTDGLLNLGKAKFAFMMPVRSSGMHRLIGFVPHVLEDKVDLSFEDIRPSVEDLLRVKIADVNWFSTYRVHHRVAETFRDGRCFIAGDAGHVHSPAGGQGMNTGIGDAVNLSWKLAHVLQGRAPSSLLDTYEAERIPFARTLVATTDRAFRGLASTGIGGRLFRTLILPYLVPRLMRSAAFRSLAFRTVSQIRIAYRASALSEGRAGRVQGGHRLPWVAFEGGDNFAALKSLDWQVHVYGRASAAFLSGAAAMNLPVHQFNWSTAAKSAGLQQDAVYLIRPDGHIAVASQKQDATRLQDYAVRRGLVLGAQNLG
jgi:2-polyprenyl-6-methoxyphenol hydroxylase-like FAD-dependent oxidoreductase